MRIIKGLLASTGILSTLLFSTPALAQKQTNTISSCYDHTTLGLTNSGRCIIRSKLEGNYIFVKIEKSWGETSYFRLSNPYCNKWRMEAIDKDCVVLESKDGFNYEDTGIIHFSTYEDEKGKENLVYTYGRAYGFQYQGPFKKPYIDPCEGMEDDTRC